jgi:hypothetical protein
MKISYPTQGEGMDLGQMDGNIRSRKNTLIEGLIFSMDAPDGGINIELLPLFCR